MTRGVHAVSPHKSPRVPLTPIESQLQLKKARNEHGLDRLAAAHCGHKHSSRVKSADPTPFTIPEDLG